MGPPFREICARALGARLLEEEAADAGDEDEQPDVGGEFGEEVSHELRGGSGLVGHVVRVGLRGWGVEAGGVA